MIYFYIIQTHNTYLIMTSREEKYKMALEIRKQEQEILERTIEMTMVTMDNFIPFLDRLNIFDLVYIEHMNLDGDEYEIKPGGYYRGYDDRILRLSPFPLHAERVLRTRFGIPNSRYLLKGIKRIFVSKETAERIIKPGEKKLVKIERMPPEIAEPKIHKPPKTTKTPSKSALRKDDEGASSADTAEPKRVTIREQPKKKRPQSVPPPAKRKEEDLLDELLAGHL